MKKLPALLVPTLALIFATAVPAQEDGKATGGRLDAIGSGGQPLGSCPLKHTAVEAEISGTLARVGVTQRFHNPFREKIEAVYVFPLHQDSAVDEMTMTVGNRVVKGIIKERGEAKRIYEDAKARGKVASLLDQERPNIFTQAVANIEPGQEVTITIRYSQTLAWEDGCYGFDFPTVVGPRYIPGASQGSAAPADRKADPQRGPQDEPPVVNPNPSPPTDQVPDAGRITPPVVEEGYRAGHDLSIIVRIQAGLPITELKSALHEIKVEHPNDDPTRALVSLVDQAVLPNRDFALSFRTAGEGITDAVLTHTDERGKFFTLVLQPPARVKPETAVPRELVFVLDTSGSMSGFPVETSKAIMRRAIGSLRPADRFNLITFSGNAAVLFDQPVENTEQNRHRALAFIDSLHGGGGTEMMKAINAALGGEHDPNKVRIVCFLTDGFVGNDLEIIGAVRKHAGTARVFSFGIGNSVNRFLMDGMAQAGRGEATYVLRGEDAEKAAAKFYQRIDVPVLTDIALDFGGLAVEAVYPKQLEDLFAARPVVVKGRYTKAGTGVVRLKGRNAAGLFEREIAVTFPEDNPENRVLASQWARAKVGYLMMQDMEGLQTGNMKAELQQEITGLGLAYNLLTQFTSFVAVEEQTTTEGGKPKTVQVPVEMPENVSYSGVFGEDSGGLGGGALSGGLGKGTGFGSGFGMGGGGTGKLFGLIPEAMRMRCTKADRLSRLAANGGTPPCEDAVVKTLGWLKQQQNPDGSWGDHHPSATTALALLTFLGHCETPASPEFGEGALKAMVYLTNIAAKNGGLLADPADPRESLDHALATCALAESATFAKEIRLQVPGLDEAVAKAGQRIIDRQLATGAWANGDAKAVGKDPAGDILLVCANLQALKACWHSASRFKGMSGSVKLALNFLKANANPDGTIAHPGAVAAAYQQWGKGLDPFARRACEQVSRQAAFTWEAAEADLTELNANAQAMIQRGGKVWTAFNAGFLPAVLKAQNPDGSFKATGPGDPAANEDKSAILRRTCLAALTLEVYYRYLSAAGAHGNKI